MTAVLFLLWVFWPLPIFWAITYYHKRCDRHDYVIRQIYVRISNKNEEIEWNLRKIDHEISTMADDIFDGL